MCAGCCTASQTSDPSPAYSDPRLFHLEEFSSPLHTRTLLIRDLRIEGFGVLRSKITTRFTRRTHLKILLEVPDHNSSIFSSNLDELEEVGAIHPAPSPWRRHRDYVGVAPGMFLGGLTIPTKELKYGFQGTTNSKNLRKTIVFHFPTGGYSP